VRFYIFVYGLSWYIPNKGDLSSMDDVLMESFVMNFTSGFLQWTSIAVICLLSFSSVKI